MLSKTKQDMYRFFNGQFKFDGMTAPLVKLLVTMVMQSMVSSKNSPGFGIYEDLSLHSKSRNSF